MHACREREREIEREGEREGGREGGRERESARARERGREGERDLMLGTRRVVNVGLNDLNDAVAHGSVSNTLTTH